MRAARFGENLANISEAVQVVKSDQAKLLERAARFGVDSPEL